MSVKNPNNNFPLKSKWDYTQIDFINQTDHSVTIDIFNTITITNFNTTPAFGLFSIVSPYNYNALLQDVQDNPMLIRRIELITQSQGQLTQPFNILTRDATGFQALIPRLPNIELSPNQFQPNIAYLDFKERELILDDNNTFSNYTFPKHSITKMLIYYKQLNRIDIFTHGITQCAELEDYLHFQDTFVSESQMREIGNEPYVIEKVKNEVKQQNRLTFKVKFMDKFRK